MDAYFSWCGTHKRKIGGRIDTFCAEFNRDRECNLIHHYLDYKAGTAKAAHPADKARKRAKVAEKMRGLRGESKKAKDERRLLLTKMGCKPKHPMSGKQFRRALVDYGTDAEFRQHAGRRRAASLSDVQQKELDAWLATSGEAKRHNR